MKTKSRTTNQRGPAKKKEKKAVVKTVSRTSRAAPAAREGSDLADDPAIRKLLEYAKGKKSVSYDEVNDFLPDSIVHSDRIEEVISLLEKHNIKLED
ncbi:MAG TPA: RNA polymerase sigma factor region1.1 domain-containing protein, partial [Spirochaetia bacterium]|nr:RNA polymerase sigma factor region1.1 domain-containing protein [Spirochaetia bacterium]